MKFEVIKNSESKTGYDIPDETYVGVVDGLVCGWQFEFVNKDGDINYNSVTYFHGTPEDYAEHWLQYGPDALFEMERWNGWEPTGRVIFRGYAEEDYDIEERDWYVKTEGIRVTAVTKDNGAVATTYWFVQTPNFRYVVKRDDYPGRLENDVSIAVTKEAGNRMFRNLLNNGFHRVQ